MINERGSNNWLLSLVIVAILLSMFAISTKAFAVNEPNLALNLSGTGFPEITASYTCGCDSVWSVVNHTFSYNTQDHDRWTSYYSGTATDWLAIDFGSVQSFNQVKLYIFNDGGGVRSPESYLIQYWNGSAWIEPTNQIRTPTLPAAAVMTEATPENTLNIADFDTVRSSQLRVVFTHKSNSASGLSELEVFLHQSVDESTATAMITQIEQLPASSEVALSDKTAIVAARTAYTNLTPSQKSLVTNLSKLTAAETAITTLETALLPKFTDISVLSAFSNAAGDTITLTLSSVIDVTYHLQTSRFHVTANTAPITLSNADYEVTDSSHRTLKLTFSTPLLLDETEVALSIQSGVLKTSNNEINHAVAFIPVITFKQLDLSLDQRIGVDDLVQLFSSPALQIDVNQDGAFDQVDVSLLLDQVSVYLK
ncbi:galactose-binding domain-containing protein [Paenibacillus agricola]|uniref:Discoidin domain-containing protein n=1 Tax=Paenibacillus agricola TaxID=2716264 RepID=A0ABX0J7H7_9BACL|nr:discoidin domain-containing protein [Paenibacillus agricola]NHN29981.1 discoidin domain-containing protein [Paenibacillus agricola]